MPNAMVSIGIVLLIHAVTGSYAIAGAVAATRAVSYAVSSPMIGRMADRLGQARLLPPLAIANAISMLSLICLTLTHFPHWTFFIAAIGIGLTSPSLGPMVRSRWRHLLSGSSYLDAAFSLESVNDEIIFITGPIIVTFLATDVGPWSDLALASTLTVTGSLFLAAQRKTQPITHSASQAGGRAFAIRSPGILIVVVIFLLIGTILSAVDIGMISFAQEHDHRSLAGVLLGIYAFGSAAGGIWYGSQEWKGPSQRRFLIALSTFVVGLIPFLLIHDMDMMLATMFFSGLAISPTLIVGFGLVGRLVSKESLTEGFTWVSTGIGTGSALGSGIAGLLVDHVGSQGAFQYAMIVGLLVLLISFGGISALSQ
jgi:MFS family permease